ncbi:HAD-IIIC family phosphatase [Moritella marina]|uniref:HAD-IIIC family phosphatase n=1 Tax=Moritella marina TaxID=90736 RepID=UPI0037039144
MSIINKKIKLVIWDLDETFWSGTFSEEGIKYSQKNHDLIIELNKRGIVQSISSKNDYYSIKELLITKGIWNYFVFPEISWNPKGRAVKSIIEDMSLRADNVLFIDDNLGNLNEVMFENPGVIACEPEIIDSLLSNPNLKGKDDSSLSRLKQYQLLEKKRKIKNENNLSNIDFLKKSEIKVNINNNVIHHIDRVLELIERTNQLNYTKNRIGKKELLEQLSADNMTSGVINVSDKYGDYGISGFYLIENEVLKHFLFSCRTMNMGIENWLYQHLNFPQLDVQGAVASEVSKEYDSSYITIISERQVERITYTKSDSKFLLIGGCDLDQLIHYLPFNNIDTQFNYVNKKNISIHGEHTTFLTKELTENNLNELNSLEIYEQFTGENKLSTDWDVLIYSPLNDYSRGLYKSKKSNLVFPFDAFKIDWTDFKKNKILPKHLSNLSSDFLCEFNKNYDYLGPISSEEFQNNLISIIESNIEKRFFFLTGAEIDIDNKVDDWETGMHKRHIKMNEVLNYLSLKYTNVELIDVRYFVKSEKELNDNLRHYIKPIYADLASEIMRFTESPSLSKSQFIKGEIRKFKFKVKNKFKSSWNKLRGV